MMGERRKRAGRLRRTGGAVEFAALAARGATGVQVLGWTILAHPFFHSQIEKLDVAAESESIKSPGGPGANRTLLAHLLDLAFDKIPRDPGNSAFRHGGALEGNRKSWFRAKTGNGRYRLFYRFQSSARLIVYAWVNDEDTLRAYGDRTDAYAVFARMLDAGNPPDDWQSLLAAASERSAAQRLTTVAKRRRPGKK